MSGTPSGRVGMVTVKSLVRQLPFEMPPTQYFFCDLPTCDVVYFPLDAAPVFRGGDLLVRVGAKEQTGPIPLCYCFGITRLHIEEELRQNGRCIVVERIKAEIRAGNWAGITAICQRTLQALKPA